MCKLEGVKNYRLPSVEGFDDEKRQIHTCNMFTMKQYRIKLCKMAHLLPTDMEKVYPDELDKMMSTGVAAAVTKLEGGKRG